MNELIDYYETNKDNPWETWLKVHSVFPRPGKQGFVGLLTSTKDKDLTYVFKVPRYINYLTEHEFEIMKSLNDLSFCPHFCRCVGTVNMSIDPSKTKGENPFVVNVSKPIEKSVLLMEYLKDSFKFFNFISSRSSTMNQIISIVSQILLALDIAQKEKLFTHYDLHSNNIMIKRCETSLVHLYVLNKENQFIVPTYGYIPVIIDFGFSYSINSDNKPLNASLNFTDSGFMSDRYDGVSDIKLFLSTVSSEVHDIKKTKESQKLLNIVQNNFDPLKIEWDSGWDTDTKKCVNDYVIKTLNSVNTSSKLFKDHDYYCMDILFSSIILPLKQQKYEDISVSYNTFILEFIKIEEQISSPFYCLYILKSIIDSVKIVRVDYSSKETRNLALSFFRSSILERVDSIAAFFDCKKIDFELLLCSLLCLSKNIEGMLFTLMLERETKKKERYNKLFLQTPIELLTVIDVNLPLTYELNEDTHVIVIDNLNKIRETKPLKLLFSKKEIKSLNSLNSFCQGKKIFERIK